MAFIVATVLSLMLGAATASAQGYGTGTLGSSTTTPGPGEPFTVTGDGCAPGADVTFAIDGQAAGSTTADSSGNFSKTLTAPAAPGTHSVTATCGARVLSLEITVQASTTTPLARTGSNSTVPMTSIALVLLAVGGLLVLMARRRGASRSHSAN